MSDIPSLSSFGRKYPQSTFTAGKKGQTLLAEDVKKIANTLRQLGYGDKQAAGAENATGDGEALGYTGGGQEYGRRSLGSTPRNLPRQMNPTSWDPQGAQVRATDIGIHEQQQQNINDCAALATLRGLASTPQGERILQNSVKQDANGNYEVMFAGDPKRRIFTVTPQDLTGNNHHYDGNDPIGQVICAAMDQYFTGAGVPGGILAKAKPRREMKMLQLLSGSNTEAFHCLYASPSAIERHLRQLAGESVAVTFRGHADENTGDWSANLGHLFTLTGIDEKDGTISYTNPWNADVPRKMSISDFANQAAHSHISIFSSAPLTPASDAG